MSRLRPSSWLAAAAARLGLDAVDRYVSRIFWSSYAVSFVFFFGFFVVLDLFTKVDTFLERAGELRLTGNELLRLVLKFYLCSSPLVFLQVAPFVTVIGVIVALARLQRHNELIPVVMSGRSLFRMLRPVFCYAALLTLAMLYVQEHVAPRVSDSRIALDELLRRGKRTFEVDRPIKDREGWLWTQLRYDGIREEVVEAWVSRVRPLRIEHGRIRGARFDAEREVWIVPGGVTLEINDIDAAAGVHHQSAEEFPSSLRPAQIVAWRKEAFDLSVAELGLLYSLTGEDRYKVLLHYHITFPLTNLLLILLTTPFVLRFDRRSAVVGLAIAFVFCGVYFGVDFSLRGLGERHLHPVLAAWFSPIFFGALGISLFDGIRT